ncbi:MAG: DNA repair protein RadA [Gammaproteobacteria bacterium]|nr:DNA repair protein RadA [Gammaproteobacteria bacterium]
MAKIKRLFNCTECGARTPKWAGQCPECESWNTLVETVPPDTRRGPVDVAPTGTVHSLAEIGIAPTVRLSTHSTELDRVLGGGLVNGAVVLLGGDPGIGKSTLLLQTLVKMSDDMNALYVSGEESAQQIALRARRLGMHSAQLGFMADNALESVVRACRETSPDLIVIDSIQTLYTELIQSAPGSVAQVRETAAQLVRLAKQTRTTVIIVGHVTKEGAIAGPRVLEHMVDTVLYFEGDRSSRFRLIRAIKNRFGAVNELGVFAMTEQGLKEVNNPSAMFVNRSMDTSPGRTVMAAQQGTRPLLVEVQALVDQSPLANPRRLTVGLDHSRLAMILAVLHRHGGLSVYDQDVFVNVVGGVRVIEPASDLAVALSVASSLYNRPWPNDLVVFGEIGLGGEVRPVQHGIDRLKEAYKLGFKRALVPKENLSKQIPKGIQAIGIVKLAEALNTEFDC